MNIDIWYVPEGLPSIAPKVYYQLRHWDFIYWLENSGFGFSQLWRVNKPGKNSNLLTNFISDEEAIE